MVVKKAIVEHIITHCVYCPFIGDEDYCSKLKRKLDMDTLLKTHEFPQDCPLEEKEESFDYYPGDKKEGA